MDDIEKTTAPGAATPEADEGDSEAGSGGKVPSRSEVGQPETLGCPNCGRGPRDKWLWRKRGRTTCFRCGWKSSGAAGAAADPEQVAREQKAEAERQERALAIWRESRSIKGTPGETYLRARGIRPDIVLWPDGWPESVRWSDDCVRTPKRCAPGIVTAIGDPKTGLVVGLHRVIFERAGKKKMTLGRMWGCAATLSQRPDPDGRWGVAEGIESALAATLLTRIPTWSALCAGNMPRVTPPPWARRVTIFADHDESGTGFKRAAEARDLWRRLPMVESVRVLAHTRVGADVNDALMEAPYA